MRMRTFDGGGMRRRAQGAAPTPQATASLAAPAPAPAAMTRPGVIDMHHKPWDGHGDSTSLTWDYAKRLRRKMPYERDMAMTTCGNGHTLRMASDVHTIAADGMVTPSYVCTVAGCNFHVWVRLVGWDPNHVFEYCPDPDDPQSDYPRGMPGVMDLGEGMFIRWDDDGLGFVWHHPKCRAWARLRLYPDPESTGHKLTAGGKDQPGTTIEGSLLCPMGCGTHGTIKDGRWIPA